MCHLWSYNSFVSAVDSNNTGKPTLAIFCLFSTPLCVFAHDLRLNCKKESVMRFTDDPPDNNEFSN